MTLTFSAADVVAALCAAHRSHQPADNRCLAEALTTPEEGYAVQRAVGHRLGWWGNDPNQKKRKTDATKPGKNTPHKNKIEQTKKQK